jgi:transglutaminase-like putative cysteine protease
MISIALAVVMLALMAACADLAKRRHAGERVMPAMKWDYKGYAAFVEENIRNIEAQYTDTYRPCRFVVDTASGARLVQELIDPMTAAAACGMDRHHPAGEDVALMLYRHVTRQYEYVIEPSLWPTVTDTIRSGKGDCKGLSLLLMSLLMAAGVDTYAAVSNGHMWVNVHNGKQWQVLETDLDPMRNRIYAIPGFYAKPLFKIYPDHSEKRRRKDRPANTADTEATENSFEGAGQKITHR